MAIVLKIENLYKEYKLGVIGHGTLYRDLQTFWAKLKGQKDPNSIIGYDENKTNNKNILAIKNISLEINSGEIVGIIGSNGAGKSTLLKLISRITSPSKGQIKIKGKVSSLLEVGTGFHPELTGRENIYLNGTINGLSKKEIQNKLEDIVNFAGVKNFLDTPVKRYSTGMQVRLGFAVAAHLEPDILIVDEVLAVGDAGFRKKAINKMKEVSINGKRTVIFVSHNMEAISQLCNKVILLDKGEIIKVGSTEKIINYYLNLMASSNTNRPKILWENQKISPGNEFVKMLGLEIKDDFNKNKHSFGVSESIKIEFKYALLTSDLQISSYIAISKLDGTPLINSLDEYSKGDWGGQENHQAGEYINYCEIPPNLLGEGVFNINLRIFSPPNAVNHSDHVRLINIMTIQVYDDFSDEGVRGSYPFSLGHPIRPKLNWKLNKIK